MLTLGIGGTEELESDADVKFMMRLPPTAHDLAGVSKVV
jgi:hypothetical protein